MSLQQAVADPGGVCGFHRTPPVKYYLSSIQWAYDSTYTEPHQNLNNGSRCIHSHSVALEEVTQHMRTRAPPHIPRRSCAARLITWLHAFRTLARLRIKVVVILEPPSQILDPPLTSVDPSQFLTIMIPPFSKSSYFYL